MCEQTLMGVKAKLEGTWGMSKVSKMRHRYLDIMKLESCGTMVGC